MKDFIYDKDATLGVIEAIKTCKKTKITKIVFPTGKYEFWPVYASEKYIYTSNNDEGSKRIVFDLSGLKNIEIDGQGSEGAIQNKISLYIIQMNSLNSEVVNVYNEFIPFVNDYSVKC